METDTIWDDLSPIDWQEFAKDWLAEIRSLPSENDNLPISGKVVMMNFTASPERQWAFILDAVKFAETDCELSHIAAGPLEHLLGWHGEVYIDKIEKQTASDPKFARTLSGVLRYKMTDNVWDRVRTIQRSVPDPLLKPE